MTVVVGTAGHIDHGKTTLLRALTGIDADRLPEEQRRGMTIDVGYAHLDLEDGTAIDFVDVPGHDALIGNMLVGAGEIDAVMLVVAADDGPRAQTLEHLELLDALGIRDGIAVVTKADVAGEPRAAEVAGAVAELLARTSLRGAAVLVASSTTGEGIERVRDALLALRDRVQARAAGAPAGPRRLAIDRAFAVRGRGAVVTGSLRGGELLTGEALRLEPGGIEVRVRGLQVHHGPVDGAAGGRTAVNLAGVDLERLVRGAVVTSGAGLEATDRLLVALARPTDLGAPASRGSRPAWPPAGGASVRLHLGTAQVDAGVGRRGREGVEFPDGRVGAILRLAEPVATFSGDRGVLRRPSPGDVVAGFVILDPDPPRGIARRRVTPERLAVLAGAVGEGDTDAAADALVGLHGAKRVDGGLVLAADVGEALEAAALRAVGEFHRDHPVESGLPVGAVRQGLRSTLRRMAAIRRDDAGAADAAIATVIDGLVARHRLARENDLLRDPSRLAP
ncbi:MAG: Selenocysteine-specific translation elongation factor, partial [Chloroflexi bacterium]|nr:Selenocysteine-specific translation elongation factor [Chloroflexota bacterium]